MRLHDLEPDDVAKRLKADEIVLIDVREPAEYASERIHGSLLYPLSTFDPHALPDANGKLVVFQCGSGVRSAKAAEKCQAAGYDFDHHLKGGLKAWKAAGLPTIGVDPATGQIRESR